MKRKVYRSLDKPSEFFGIKGRFMIVFLILCMFSFMVGMFFFGLFEMFIGIAVFAVLAVMSYMYTLVLQAKIKEKHFIKMISRLSYPDVYSVRPKHIRNIWRGFNLNNRLLND